MQMYIDLDRSSVEEAPLSQTSLQEEYCKTHPGELFVAHAQSPNRLLCNQCIYESDISCLEDSSLNFTCFIAGNLKDLFDSKFEQYRQSLSQMQSIAPQ